MSEDARKEAISHIVQSAKYWSHDNMKYDYVLPKEEAFQQAVNHVRRYHYSKLCDEDINEAKKRLGL